ncbi:hypothetical protein [Pseudonocardia sp. ICBG1142]|uniref:hypothetical protein n=1 Tax=Pseudonocardia sp. ICBG1142 TaxID=2846760 RepID=UPI001CF6085D|nr:hypothetical protein [Pseudonocardia sp. ICBG1142]
MPTADGLLDPVAASIIHIARTSTAVRDLVTVDTLDAVAILAARLAGIRSAFALSLAREWLAAAERAAASTSPASAREFRTLTLIAQTLRVPVDYFLNPAVARLIDDRHALDGEARRRGIAVHGPCRSSSFTNDELVAIHSQLQLELSRRSNESAAGT